MVSWTEFHGQVAKILNMHPDNLQLQYKFSSELPKALPFNLSSLELYEHMLQRFKPHAVANHKQKPPRREIRVDIFHKDVVGGGKSGGMAVKVNVLMIISTIVT